jgi:uncharacterized protein YoxC
VFLEEVASEIKNKTEKQLEEAKELIVVLSQSIEVLKTQHDKILEVRTYIDDL